MDISPYSIISLASVTFFFVLCSVSYGWTGHFCKCHLFNLFFLILALSKLIAYFIYKLTLKDHFSTYTHQPYIRDSLATSINHGLLISYVVQNLLLSLKCIRNAPQSPTVLPSVCSIKASLNESHMQKAVHLRIPPESQFLTFHVLGIWHWWLDFPGSRTIGCHGQRPTRNAGEKSRCIVGKCRVLALVLVLDFPMFLSAAASLSAGA